MRRFLPLLVLPLTLVAACGAEVAAPAAVQRPVPTVSPPVPAVPSKPPAATPKPLKVAPKPSVAAVKPVPRPTPSKAAQAAPAPAQSPKQVAPGNQAPVVVRRVEEPPLVADPARTVLFGDSIAVQTGPVLAQVLPQTSVAAFGGTALCDWVDSGLYAKTIAQRKPGVVVLSFNGNNLTPCVKGLTGAKLAAAYSRSAKEAIFLARAQGVARVIIVRGPIGDPRWQKLGGVSSRTVMDGWTYQPGAQTSNAGSRVPTDGYLPDGLHLNAKGVAAYARGIAASVQEP